MSDKASEDRAKIERVAHEHRGIIARCRELAASPHFAWFIQECVGRKITDETEAALNLKRSPEERNESAHRLDALNAVAEWLEKTEQESRKLVQIAEKPAG